jgi:peptidoglycan DL-endopeptidase CwlO
MIRLNKIATYMVIGTMAIAGRAAVAQASEESIAGIPVVLDEFLLNAQESDEIAVQNLLSEMTSEFDNLAFAQVTNYVNIRSKASEEGEILGKLYNNSAAAILEKAEGWYKIKSGTVTGYIKADFLITGKEAEKLAKKVGTQIAIVDTTTLKVRKEPSTEATVLTLIPIGDEFKITKEKDGWAKISLDDNSYGYVSTDYIKIQTVFEEAISIEEERERLEEEAAANQQNSSNSSSNSSGSSSSSSSSSSGSRPNSSSNNSSSSGSSSSSSNSSSSLGGRIADYAVQFQGNPYVWGGTSLTNGADCSGFTQSVFAHFGIGIPRTSRSQASSGRRVSFDSLQQGDLVFYSRNGTINHVAIYIGNGRVISASSPSTGIRITSYNYRTPVKAVRYTY